MFVRENRTTASEKLIQDVAERVAEEVNTMTCEECGSPLVISTNVLKTTIKANWPYIMGLVTGPTNPVGIAEVVYGLVTDDERFEKARKNCTIGFDEDGNSYCESCSQELSLE